MSPRNWKGWSWLRILSGLIIYRRLLPVIDRYFILEASESMTVSSTSSVIVYTGCRSRIASSFKLCLLTFKAVNGFAPFYLTDLCCPLSTMDSRRRLRFAARGDPIVDTYYADLGQRLFSVAVPKARNELPDWLCNRQAVDSFKAALKTFLFTL